jgi:ABC-type spermidine/putrescine transport system permease subunit II
MTLYTTDYLEYYLTLVGWVVNNGIWNILVASGVFALPFVAIVMQEWLRPAAKGRTRATRACCPRCASRTACGWRSW